MTQFHVQDGSGVECIKGIFVFASPLWILEEISLSINHCLPCFGDCFERKLEVNCIFVVGKCAFADLY